MFRIFLGGFKRGEFGGLVSPHRETRGSGGSVPEGSQIGAKDEVTNLNLRRLRNLKTIQEEKKRLRRK
jgi:hypothetical protein